MFDTTLKIIIFLKIINVVNEKRIDKESNDSYYLQQTEMQKETVIMPRLYYFTASDSKAKKHLEETIVNEYHIAPLLNKLNNKDDSIVGILEEHNKNEQVHMWGATPGDANISRWKRLKTGDKVLVYTEGTFIAYGTIFAKTHNKEVAQHIWGNTNEGQTWEYIYFIEDLISMDIDKKEFAAFFNYKLHYFPQGFGNVSDEKLQANLQRFETIDEMIRVLNTEFVISIDDLEEANFQNNLDSDYTDVNTDDIPKTPQRKKQKTEKKYSQWDRKQIISKKAIKLANFKCEIDDTHKTFISETSNKMFMEAHHLIPLRNQNEFEYDLDIVQNIVSICPNCHRKIHLAKASEKQKILETLFEKRKDQLELMGHDITEKYFLSLYGILNK